MDQVKLNGRTKVNKPLAERRRRARINDALLQLKAIVLQTVGNETNICQKLEKADILEMTVQYIHSIQNQQSSVTTGLSTVNSTVVPVNPLFALVTSNPQFSTTTGNDQQCALGFVHTNCSTALCGSTYTTESVDPKFTTMSSNQHPTTVSVDPQSTKMSIDQHPTQVSANKHPSTMSVDPQTATKLIEPQYITSSIGDQSSSASVMSGNAKIPIDQQYSDVSIDSQYGDESSNLQCDQVSSDPQCESISYGLQNEYIHSEPECVPVNSDLLYSTASLYSQNTTVSDNVLYTYMSTYPQSTPFSVDPQFTTESANPQYTSGFTTCAVHVKDHLRNVSRNYVTCVDNDNLGTRLFDHLTRVNVKSDPVERDGRKQDTHTNQTGENILNFTEKHADSENTEHEQSCNQKNENKKINQDTESVNLRVNSEQENNVSSKTKQLKTYPKKRNLLKEFTQSPNTQRRSETSQLGKVKGANETVRNITKCSPLKKSKTFPKPIKKRITAMVTEPWNADVDRGNDCIKNSCSSSTVNCELSNTAFTRSNTTCKLDAHGGATILQTYDDKISGNGYTNRMGTPSLNQSLFTAIENGDTVLKYNTRHQKCVDFSSNSNAATRKFHKNLSTTVQTGYQSAFVNEPDALRAAHQSRYGTNTCTDLLSGTSDSDTVYNFYQGFFVGAEAGRVWRPW